MKPRIIQTGSRGNAIVVALVLLAAIAAGIMFSRGVLDQSQELRAASVFPTPRLLNEFELATAEGEVFDEQTLKGQWTLLFFGFTNCPDICPDTLASLSQSMDALRLMKKDPLPEVVFVSVDPKRDQGELLSDYVAWFDEAFTAVTGNDDQLAGLTQQLGVIFVRDEADPQTGYYNVDHSAAVMIIDPEGRLYGRFGHPLDPDDVTADLFQITS
ncbi:MAG: SCO family protein [Wenzhouxiangella sp.]|nr:SCO family protein [Wenzhouxiangella sp.]